MKIKQTPKKTPKISKENYLQNDPLVKENF